MIYFILLWHAITYFVLKVPLNTHGVNLVHNVGDVLCRGLGDRSPPVGSRGEAPVAGGRESGGRSPQKLKQFWISICILLTEF